MLKLQQAIVVEGKYDKNTLSQLVDAPIFTTEGFGVMNDKALLQLLRQVAKKRGLIILTDSDGAGFVIRSYLRGALPKENVYHAYIPDLYGKEPRKRAPGKEGKLGVEGMRPEVLLRALNTCGVAIEQSAGAREPQITKQTLYELGLSGGADSREKRLCLQKRLGLPEHLSSNALLQVLNILYTPKELSEILEEHHG